MKIGSYVALKDKLSGEYLEKFNYVEHYGNLRKVGSEAMAEKMMDLMDLMLEAQEKGMPAEHVVGKNIKDFCKNYFSDVTVFDMLKDAAKQVRTWSWVILVLELMFIFAEDWEGGFSFFTYKTDVSGYFFGIMIAWAGIVAADIVGIVLAKLGYYSRKVWVGVAAAGTLTALILLALFSDNEGSMKILGWPLLVFSGLYLLGYYGAIFWSRYKLTGSIRKQENEYETTFTGLVMKEMDAMDCSKELSVVKPYAKRYIRKNRRLVKKGREPLTTAEYLERQEKVNKRSVWQGFALGLIIGLGIILPVSCINSSEPFFPGPMDVIMFILVMAGMMGLAMALVLGITRPVNRAASKQQQALLRACRERGVELDVYYEMLAAGKTETAEQENSTE